MKTFLAAFLVLAALSSPAHAANNPEPDFLSFKELLQEPAVKAQLKPGLRFYFGDEPPADIVEKAPGQTYTDVSLSAWSSRREHCVSAFAAALGKMIEHVQAKGFDSVLYLRSAAYDVYPESREGIPCVGSIYVQASVWGVPALSRAGADKLAARPARQPEAPRDPADGARFLKLGDLLQSAQMKTALGGTRLVWLGQPTPRFIERFGPENYKGSADPREIGVEAACRKALVSAVSYMKTYAKEYRHDALVHVQSYYRNRPTPEDDEFECLVESREVSVTLRGSTVKTLP